MAMAPSTCRYGPFTSSRLLDLMGLDSLASLHEKVLREGWYPVHRSAASIWDSQGQANIRMVLAFASHLGLEAPTSFGETVPASSTMLIHWRVLLCIL